MLCFFGAIALYALLRASETPEALLAFTVAAMGAENVGNYLAFSDEFIASYLIGPLVAVHFLGAHGLASQLHTRLARIERPIRWLAQSTFALYLLHYPLLRFADAAFAHDETSPLQVLALFLGVTGLCIVIGPAIERTKEGWKLLQPARWRTQAA